MTKDDLVASAAMLRAVVDALPPATPRERATARRLEGAAVALDVLARRFVTASEPLR